MKTEGEVPDWVQKEIDHAKVEPRPGMPLTEGAKRFDHLREKLMDLAVRSLNKEPR